MNLEYALITSASLPDRVKGSVNYVSLQKDQWLDLVDYSEDLVNDDPDQRILLLICARGTSEQEEADTAQRQETKERQAETQRKLEEADALKDAKEEREQNVAEETKKRSALRKKSKSIFNALYGK